MHTQEKISSIDVSQETFQDYLQSEDHREYQEFLSTIILNQGNYETSWIATNGREQKCKDTTFLLFPSDLGKPLSDLKKRNCNEVFTYLDTLICEHNGFFYDSDSEKGVLIDILIGRKGSNIARYSGKERSICLTPYIEGITKHAVINFIQNTMNFKKILQGLNKNPLESPNIIKGTSTSFLTCCNRITGDFFYLYDGGYNMAVLLPDTDLEISSRRYITTKGIKDSPEIKLLSFMANYLRNDYIIETPKSSNDEIEQKRLTLEEELDLLKILPPKPREFPGGKPISLYAALKFIKDIPPEELLQIFEPLLSSNGNKDFPENSYALCTLISEIVKNRETILPNNPKYFRTSFPIDWETFFKKRIDRIQKNGGYKKPKLTMSPENLWGEISLT